MYVPWGAQVSNAYDAVALGAGSQTSVNGGVALGAGAVASRDTSDLKSLPYDAAYANGGAIHTRKYNSPARTSVLLSLPFQSVMITINARLST